MSQSTALKPFDAFKHDLTTQASNFKTALPSHVQPEKFIRVVTTAVSQNPKLLEASRPSLWLACMKAAQDGLLPDNREAAFVQFGEQVQYMPMVGGILKKIRNSGELKSIVAHLRYQADSFRYFVDEDGEHFTHTPNFDVADRGQILGAYALAQTKDGGVYFEYMNVADVEAVRAVSKSANGPAWKNWWGEQAKKSVLKRISKRLPMSTDLEQAIAHDNEDYDLNTGEVRENAASPVAAAAGSKVKPNGRGSRPRNLQKAMDSEANSGGVILENDNGAGNGGQDGDDTPPI